MNSQPVSSMQGVARSRLVTIHANGADRQVVQCRPNDPLQAVLSMMSQRGLVYLPVVDDHSRPLGVINARNTLRVLLADERCEEALLRDYVMGVGYR